MALTIEILNWKSARKMASQIQLSYRAVYNAVMAIRWAILSHAEDAETLLGGEIELDESYFGGRRKETGAEALPAVPSFGILEERPGPCECRA